MEEIEFEITWDYRRKAHKVYVDIGDESLEISRAQLEAMLAALDEADTSA